MVIENAKRTGNCFILKLKGISLSDGMSGILGIKNVYFELVPIISASITLRFSFVTISLVPLHRPSEGIKFRSSIITAPFFNFSLLGGIPVGVRLFKNSQDMTVDLGDPHLKYSRYYRIPLPCQESSSTQHYLDRWTDHWSLLI
ncbi:hypothetical protein AVEN_242269-1 [Araneus ventricosus]|uniref:Uncharacterized protein n=1 Tax=Araneus ventricosus TaxID=182803 RepID=A0A4Y2NZP9_ARAVE|nr:hypothetical protein AVEN_242269-1 [Araneus ventricosus]